MTHHPGKLGTKGSGRPRTITYGVLVDVAPGVGLTVGVGDAVAPGDTVGDGPAVGLG